MARVSEIVVAIEAEGTEKVLTALNQVEGAQVKSVQTTKQLGAQTKQATAQAGEGWAMLVTGVNQAIGVMQTVVQIGKAVYDMAKQGAQLEFMAGKFDRLSLAAGTTADVLLSDLRKATQGTRSDMELMASAGDFMSLGLAKSSDEVVRLTTVAGALNMDMNQLALTLSNQTTMRFDQLGVSVDGFKEKVARLEAAGMSANDAFKEAFLQQAEAQIQRVGNAADSSIGGFMQLEAAVKNLADVMKTDFANSMDEVTPLLTGIANGMADSAKRGADYRNVMRQMKDALDSGIISQTEYSRAIADMGVNSSKGAVSAEKLAAALAFLDGAYKNYDGTVDMTAEKTIALEIELAKERDLLNEIPYAAGGAGDATLQFAGATERAALIVDNFLEKAGIFKADFENIFSITSNMRGIIGFAKRYDDIMGEIAAKEAELAKMPYWKQVGKEGKAAQAVVDGLKASLSDMANQVTLDMFQATIAIGGVTRTEMQAYFDMAEQMGLVSRNAAQAAIAAYGDALSTINGMELDGKTGNIYVSNEQALAAITQVQALLLAQQNGNLDITVRYLGTSGDPDPQAGAWMEDQTVTVKTALDTSATDDYIPVLPDIPVVTVLNTSEVDSYTPTEVKLPTSTELDTSNVDAWTPPTKYGTVVYLPERKSSHQAIGGPVYSDSTYLWQEPGREGELFIPEQYGRVMNNHQVAQAIRDAIFMSGSGSGRSGGSPVTTDRSVHNTYHINAQYKQEPALTLSQHLKILSTLGGRV